MEATEDLKGREIKYFIPKIPTALLYDNETIGLGYSSRTVPMKLENICDLVVDFVSCDDKTAWNYAKLAKLFIPCFPIKVMIKNESELVKAYSDGDFSHPIITEGLYSIRSNTTVLFRTVAYGASPGSIRANLTAATKDKNHWLAKMDASFKALSSDKNYIDFQIIVKRGVNVFDLIESIKGIVRLRAPMYPINNYVSNEKMVPVNPPQVIQMWYKERYRSILGAKKHRQQELQLIRMRLETYLIVCGHVEEVINIIRTMELPEIHKSLKSRFGLSTRQCEILLEANLQILMKSKKPELEGKLAKVADELAAIEASFKNIDNEICAEVKAIKKKHKTDMAFASGESKYIGCLIVGDLGIVQINNLSEVIDTGSKFNGVDLRFLSYCGGVKNIKFNKSSTAYQSVVELPYTTNSSGISIQYRTKTHLFVRTGGKSRCANNGTIIQSTRSIINHVSSKPLVILTTGKITKAPEELFDNRKHSSNILYAFDEIPGTGKYVVISVNDAHPNVIRIQAVTTKDRLLFSGAGETSIVAVVDDTTNEVIINLPEFHKNSIMYVTDIVKHANKGKLQDVNVRAIPKM